MVELTFNEPISEIMSWPNQQPNYFNPIHQSLVGPPLFGGTLTQIPRKETSILVPHKRSSLEMEDDQFMTTNEPPAKQLLSENKLLRQFGSLNIDGTININKSIDEDEKESNDTSGLSYSGGESSNAADREEFNRYVYLLFKDKKTEDQSFGGSDATLARLAREERDKLSKAVVLWNPPLKDNYFNEPDGSDDDDDEEFKYKDHNDFKKSPEPQLDADGDVMME